MTIKQALIMAAGKATRMRPLTDDMPKPLLQIGGKPLLTHIIEHLNTVNVATIIINGWHAIGPLKTYMTHIKQDYPHIDFILSEETELLETGGGAVQALQYLNPDEPFYMINGDAFWVNATHQNTLQALADRWTKTGADLILLLQPIASMDMTGAVGDYHMDGSLAIRSLEKQGHYMFAGIRIAHPRILDGYKADHFSFLKIMDAMEAKGTLHALPHQGQWYHISTPADLEAVNATLFKVAS